ncbi:hypothetical protein TW81_17970 [Vibrio galatheae]|uniref:Lipoprotein n=1 Tax=Vibrio galatheae TaxID=579748 RepID=A0A0F4NEU1_9VIBR|nr:hypothetical protein [Vibrio galatheae]KJY81444.1 hypothetical protein TW81_17970 [Vibrio galatheae]
MKEITLFCLFPLIVACSGVDFMGAQRYLSGGFYAERWFLNEAHDKSELPPGTALYGESANKIEHMFTVRYYVMDGQRNNIEIPSERMWKVIPDEVVHVPPVWRYKNIYLYKKEDDTYIKDEQLIALTSLRSGAIEIPIQSCDPNGWCKSYVSRYYRTLYKGEVEYNFDDVYYIKKQYLYKGEDRLFESQKRELKTRNAKAKVAQLPFITPSKEVCIKNRGEVERDNKCYLLAHGWKASQICSDSGGRLPTNTELMEVVQECGGPIKDNDLPKPHEKNSREIDSYDACVLDKGFVYSKYFTSETKDSESAGGSVINSVQYVHFEQGESWWSGTDLKNASGNVICHEM